MRPLMLLSALVLAAPALAASPVTVVDRAGRPVEGAVVTSAAAPAEGVRTDAEGRAEVAGGTVRIAAAGFLPYEGPAGDRLVLIRPSRVVVRAVDRETGAAVETGRLRLWRAEDGESGEGAAVDPAAEPPLAERVLAGGRALFDDLPAGTYRVRLEAPGYMAIGRAVAPAPESADEVTLRLSEASVVEGRVLAEGKPVAGARLRVVPGVPEQAMRAIRRGGGGPGRGGGRGRAGRGGRGGRGGGPGGLAALGPAAGQEITTDAAGRFRFDQLPAERRIPFLLVAQAPDLRWGLATIEATGIGRGRAASEKRDLSLDVDVAGGRAVTGVATWSDGAPAIGVPVVAEFEQEMRGFGGSRRFGIGLRPVFEEWGGGPEAVTGPDGEFVLRGLPLGTWRLLARPLEHAPSEPVPVALEAGTPPLEPVRLEIARGASVEGLVVDASGNPIPHAAVTGELRADEQRWPDQVLETSSDAKGRFALSGFDPGDVTLRVSADGFGDKTVAVGSGAEASRQRIVLTRTGRLFGIALNGATGEPLTRFSVAAVRAEDEPESRRNRFFGRSAGTEIVAEDGRFELDEIEEGRWAVLVRAEGYLSRVGEPVEVRAGEAADAGSVALTPGATLDGRVEDADTGEPIEGASVTVEGMGGVSGRLLFARAGRGGSGEAPTDTTGADGTFRLDGLPPGEFTVTASHHAYPVRGAHSLRVSVGADPTATLALVSLRMEAGGTVAGRVLDASGQGVPSALVVAVDPASRGRGAMVGGPIEADAEGSFVLESLPAGSLTLRRADRMDGGVEVLVRKGEVAEVILQDAGARVFGSVLVSGRPVEARVRLLAGRWGAPSSEWGTRYELAGVPPGEWALRVDVRDPAEPSAPMREERAVLTVPEGVTELAHDIRLEAEDTSDDVVVEGRVVDAENGEGLSGWLVSARKQGTPTETTRTDETGSFRITLAESGEWRVAVTGVGDDALRYDAPEPRTLVAENGRLVGEPPYFEATRRLDLDVRVVDIAGAPLVGATCMLVNKAEHLSPQSGLRLFGPRGSVTDELGRARVTASTEGLHDLVVILPARALVIRPQVRVGGPEVEVLVPPTGSLEIRGAPEADLLDLPGGWWMKVRAGQQRNGLLETRGDTLFVHGLPAASYRVQVGGEVREAEVVPGPANAVVDFAG